MWIDSHCHLNYDYSPKSTEDLVREAQAEGVTHLMTIGTDLTSLPKVVEISEKFPNVHHTVGVHPHDAATIAEGDIDRLRQAAKHPKCRAIGEIGLDTHYEHSPLDVQLVQLRQQLDLALECGLPVIIHSREAEKEMLEELTRYAAKVAPGIVPGIIHCFTGTREFGQACIDLGFYISFSGILTFKNALDLRESAKAFPLERLLVETDSPYLAPVPFRGKKCEPRMVKQTGLFLAELKGVDPAEVARVTSENARRVFRI
jgi:TatD DNase family protein